MILLTGGTGFIGKRIHEILKLKGYNIRLFSRKTGGDVRIFSSCLEMMEGVDVVIHAAGEKRDPKQFFSVAQLATD